MHHVRWHERQKFRTCSTPTKEGDGSTRQLLGLQSAVRAVLLLWGQQLQLHRRRAALRCAGGGVHGGLLLQLLELRLVLLHLLLHLLLRQLLRFQGGLLLCLLRLLCPLRQGFHRWQ